MKYFELVDKLEAIDDAHYIPSKARVKVLTEQGEVFEVSDTNYEIATNTLWLKAEIAE